MAQEREKSREEGWDSTRDTRIKEYNALFDPNMRHFFETPSVQGHLLRTGQVLVCLLGMYNIAACEMLYCLYRLRVQRTAVPDLTCTT